MKKIAAIAVTGAIALGLTSCSTSAHPQGRTTGTFPYCSYTPVTDGVLIPQGNKAPCVVDDTRPSSDRTGYAGGNVIIVPRGTGGVRTPLPVPATPSHVSLTKKK